ncbi:putative serine carboxypeptidase CPVL-like protein [Dinothrombium tinctorium]|uniref:Putative serine carboxypeptidase CPVL-like protein n=1 Tax=Dinothrombium tinctorium TaxID=1965070 RepID=A0A443R4Z5_9ACAR|nr:putative serine carboxypeptidase CPVL-like protein [Dinothrombium tinctorium]RWS13683.1 putative serine carboxypeptidase CPVL-like protein [Dinothrombium tinctorium]
MNRINLQIPDAPIILWLQGGPGLSSLIGLFVLNGPFRVRKDLSIARRKYSWTKAFSMLYIDNPVGCGFSFTRNDSGYAINQNDVANNLFEALRQFFLLFPELNQNEFYISGQSYAGKYVPSIARKICQQRNNVNFNLTGIAIGNAFIDPISFLDFADMMFEVGLIDKCQASSIRKKEKLLYSLTRSKEFSKAYYLLGEIEATMRNYTGYSYFYNYLTTEEPRDQQYFYDYLKLNEVRKAIHVGNINFGDRTKHLVSEKLVNDFLDSVKPWFEEVLDCNYKVLVYSGNLDVTVSTSATEKFLQTLNWTYADEFTYANRYIWLTHKDRVAGYIKRARNLWFIIVRNAGHLVPYDQPRVAFEMITKFVYNSD